MKRSIFIRQTAVIAAGTAFGKPLAAIASWRPGFFADPFLDKDLADALCTLVVLGYSKEKSRTFQYDGNAPDSKQAKEEKADYEAVRDLFTKLKVNITVSSSDAQQDFPFIVACTDRIKNVKDAKLALSQDYRTYLKQINDNANKAGSAPKGAYIGGMSTISTLFIVGPTKLAQYVPTYRKPDDARVEESFNKAKSSINSSIAALKDIVWPRNFKVTNADLTSQETASFSSGKLYKAYHGMILAMVKYRTQYDKNSFIFEIALGNNTTKVSSCFACSTYMEANGTPASSTHLGRGDNWGIPDENDKAYKPWVGKISDWYKSGKSVFTGGNSPNAPAITRLLAELGKNNRERDIHKIFLEALTFENSFTDRIKSTFNYKS